MISKKSSTSKNSTSNLDKDITKIQEDLFNQNQLIIANLEQTYLSKIEGVKIDSDNCLEAIEEIAEKKLGEIKETHQLCRRIIHALDELRTTDLSSVNKMMVFRNVLSQSITSFAQLSDILASIRKYLFSNFNLITSVCSKIFYSYVSFVCSKHQQLQTKQLLKMTVRSYILFISECVYHIFRPLFLLFEKKNINVLKTLKQRLIPVLITQTPEWKIIYPKIIKMFGKKPLKVLKDEQPSYFSMHDQFNCESCANPFIRTIVNLQELDSTASVKQKLKVLKEIKMSIQEDIKDHQLSTFIEVDVSEPPIQDLIPCLQYCIMKSDRAGIVQSMQYIELFFEKQSKRYYQQQFLDSKGINHILKSIKSAGEALRQRDTQLSIIHSNMLID